MPDVVIAFFGLGLLAGLLKSDLRVPESTYETLSILLMLTLGLKGGMALHGHTDQLSFAELGLVIGLGLAIPLALYPILKKWFACHRAMPSVLPPTTARSVPGLLPLSTP